MGFFSFKTQDTDKSIANQYSPLPTFPVYMIDNQGNVWKEENYDGYGEFGGKDYYELLAEMNGLGSDRDAGIDLSFSDKEYITPNLLENPHYEWRNEEPKACEFQGYFYELEYEDSYDDNYGEDEE